MQIDIRKVRIPARENAPETYIGVRVVYKNQEALNTLPYTFILPGGPGSNHSYYLDYDCLSEVTNLLYYDPRGCGLSDKGELSDYSMENYIDDLHCVQSSFHLNEAIILGKSYGAMCALGYTLRYPQQVSKLILAAGVPSYEFINTAKLNLHSRGTSVQQHLCRDLWRGKIQNDEQMADYFKIMAPLYSWKKRNNQIVTRIAPTHRFSFEALNEGFGKEFGRFNYIRQLCNIKCPTLILVGEEDWITDPQYSQSMAELISDSQIHCFKQADHALESDVPDFFFSTIMRFI